MVSQFKTHRRYHIETKKAANVSAHPYPFKVKVKRFALLKLLLKELWRYRKLDVVANRPCVYGVFSGPVGGFMPREQLCVGCLRCTTQYPDVVTILRHPKRALLGDEYFTADYVDTVVHEAESGRVPIRGQGYRGKFGGSGWDGMWTDMSEIVRPTRDGIHGREYISTQIDIGSKAPFLKFDADKQLAGPQQDLASIPLPMLFDVLPTQNLGHRDACLILSDAAQQLETFAIFPIETLIEFSIRGSHAIPLVASTESKSLEHLGYEPTMIALSGWEQSVFQHIQEKFPKAIPILRVDFDSIDPLLCYRAGVRVFHFTANYHGHSKHGAFIMDLIRKVHLDFVNAGCRDEVTIIGSGGIIAAEHVPKAIICGLDVIALDTPLLAALQAGFQGPCISREQSQFQFPKEMHREWGVQRIKNLAGSWRDQLLEILGAMGLREVKRLRGEMGRAMFQKDLENEAFKGITGYASQ